MCRTNRTRVGFSCESVLEMHTFNRSMMSMRKKKTKIDKYMSTKSVQIKQV